MPRTYTVQPGDTLSGIAQQQLGNASRWPEIFLLNRSIISHPDRISPGQVLTLPGDAPMQPSPLHRAARRHAVGHRPARTGKCQPLARDLRAQP
jgi:LysM repeat protein